MVCPLCECDQIEAFEKDSKRSWNYWHCGSCDLVFRDPQSYLSLLQEKTRYQSHNNSIENHGYVRFLSPVVETLKPFVGEKDKGLDYGCGPGPIMDQLFADIGVEIDLYDPFFYPNKNLQDQYDFITCTEVAEHFYHPGTELQKLNKLLKPGGYLLIMTEVRPKDKPFLEWGYRMDPTHVCFYSEKVWQWLSERWGYQVLHQDRRIALLQKSSASLFQSPENSLNV